VNHCEFNSMLRHDADVDRVWQAFAARGPERLVHMVQIELMAAHRADRKFTGRNRAHRHLDRIVTMAARGFYVHVFEFDDTQWEVVDRLIHVASSNHQGAALHIQ